MAESEFQTTSAALQSTENRLVNIGLTKLPPPVVSGMTLGADISLRDVDGNTIVTFNKVDTDPATVGVVWVVSEIDGWWTLPEPELPDLPRGWGDGSYDSRGRFTARNLSLAGTFLTQSPLQVAAARAKLVRAIDLVYKGGWLVVEETASFMITAANATTDKLTIPLAGILVNQELYYETDEFVIPGLTNRTTYYVKTAEVSSGSTLVTLSKTVGGTTINIGSMVGLTITVGKQRLTTPQPKSAFVRLSGRPEIATVNARGRTEFSVGLKASDPIKYEWLTTGTGIVEGYRKVSLTANTATTITNTGNTRVPVIFEINGPTTGTKTITRAATNTTGIETISIVSDIPTGNKLTIDTLNREVLLEDADGVVTNARNYVSTLSDWIFLGANPDTTNGASTITSSVACDVFYRSGWIA